MRPNRARGREELETGESKWAPLLSLPFILLKLEMELRASHSQEALCLRDILALKGPLLFPALP